MEGAFYDGVSGPFSQVPMLEAVKLADKEENHSSSTISNWYSRRSAASRGLCPRRLEIGHWKML